MNKSHWLRGVVSPKTLNDVDAQDSVSDEECSNESSSSAEQGEEDGEFAANEEDGEMTFSIDLILYLSDIEESLTS